jgi:hypothetical protein
MRADAAVEEPPYLAMWKGRVIRAMAVDPERRLWGDVDAVVRGR